MPAPRPSILALTAGLVLLATPVRAQSARILEETRVLTTYPFSEPNAVPILTQDPRMYPYHAFEGYATDPVPRPWKVVRLANDLIEVFVLPEVGGKVWGGVVKATGHEFIYRNEVLKFRNIALRGPWTSGGIEFNFGVIGHTPSTATPVDYLLRENPDGSVSCIVGAMDLPSRTHWRVEIRLPPDRAAFETRALWYNPTPLEQPYYNWMTAAAFARADLEMFIPGNAYLEHSGWSRPWPVDAAGRYLPRYASNTFGGHKSYHVVGELADVFGGYYHDDEYGFGHWAPYEDMPGQKLWLWALSREGGVWEGLLTDTDGQYVEYQAGRLFVQYAPGAHHTPITQAGFAPGATDAWSETWFPIEGLGGLTAASPLGAMFVRREAGRVVVRAHAFADMGDTLRVRAGDRTVASVPVTLRALEPVELVVEVPPDVDPRVSFAAMGLDYHTDPATRALARPFATDSTAWERIPDVRRHVVDGRELAKARRYRDAQRSFAAALEIEPWNREALLGLADLAVRRASYAEGLAHVRRVLELDTYDADANFLAGTLYRALGRTTDAREAYGWAARSPAYRSAAYVQLADLALAAGDPAEAVRHARRALDYDARGVPARQILAMAGRSTGDRELASSALAELGAIDPLQHFALAEAFLTRPDGAAADALIGALRSEYPEQTVLELAVDYARRGAGGDARVLLELGARVSPNPLLRAWLGWLSDDPTVLPNAANPRLVFPYRPETLPVLQWAAERNRHWSWTYLLALNLWALDRPDEAAVLMERLAGRPDFAPFYVTRGLLLQGATGADPENDLRRAVRLDGRDRTIRVHLVRYLQEAGRWEDALRESRIGRERFPGDDNLDLLEVRALNNLARPLEAIAILDAARVLPSENARESHRLFEQAHVLAALDAMDAGRLAEAWAHLERALEWPEHLGQGRPYEPDERLVRYLRGVVARARDSAADAPAEFGAVVRATDLSRIGDRFGLLAIPAAAALDRTDDLPAPADDPSSPLRQAAAALIRAERTGRGAEAAATLAADHPALFADLDGRILLRALSARR